MAPIAVCLAFEWAADRVVLLQGMAAIQDDPTPSEAAPVARRRQGTMAGLSGATGLAYLEADRAL